MPGCREQSTYVLFISRLWWFILFYLLCDIYIMSYVPYCLVIQLYIIRFRYASTHVIYEIGAFAMCKICHWTSTRTWIRIINHVRLPFILQYITLYSTHITHRVHFSHTPTTCTVTLSDVRLRLTSDATPCIFFPSFSFPLKIQVCIKVNA